jgi:type II secretory pathway component PulC
MRLTRKLVANVMAIRPPLGPPSAPHRATGPRGLPAPPAASNLAPTLIEVDPDEYLITRGVEDEALAEVAALMPGTRITPSDGRTSVVAEGIRPNMVIARLGFRNGDLVRSFNHVDVGSPEAALEAYARFKDSSDLVVEVVRDGGVRKLRYHVI